MPSPTAYAPTRDPLRSWDLGTAAHAPVVRRDRTDPPAGVRTRYVRPGGSRSLLAGDPTAGRRVYPSISIALSLSTRPAGQATITMNGGGSARTYARGDGE